MTFVKRMVLAGSLMTFLAAGMALQAAPGKPRPCGPPKGFAAFLQKMHVTNAKIQLCPVTPVGPDQGVWCVDPGHHCNDGSGPGKCANDVDSTGVWSCVCKR
jgi:hypothetical protein